MGKYIVKVTKKQTREVVVDASNAHEAKKRGMSKLRKEENAR